MTESEMKESLIGIEGELMDIKGNQQELLRAIQRLRHATILLCQMMLEGMVIGVDEGDEGEQDDWRTEALSKLVS